MAEADEANNLRPYPITVGPPPTVTTDPTSALSQTTATLNGTVNPNGNATTAWFQWGITTAYGQTTPIRSLGAGSTAQNLSEAISGLTANTTYHFRVVAQNGAGTSNGTDRAFTTLPNAPIVTACSATNVTAGSATLNATANANGSAGTAWFEWGTTTAYGNATPVQNISGSLAMPLSANITGLSAQTTYHCRLVAQNTGGAANGTDGSFSTPTTTGMRNPAANAAETSSAGDNNGFEITPANAHTDDTLNAVDTDSGNSTGTNCTSTGKDKHRFYNYGFAVPSGASVHGITVRLDARADSTSGAPQMCVQLSWNGGTNWSNAKTVNLTATMASYTLGGAADTWGHGWTASELSDANFRVRVMNVSSNNGRDFYLDWAPAEAVFTPPPPSAPTITSTPVTTGVVGVAYSYQATATGTVPITWSVVAGPTGLAIGSTTGLVSWTPTVGGSFPVTIRATNSVGSQDQSYTITIPTNTGLRNPTANTADSGGDANGYQTTPANAHVDDTLNAVDTDSGTSTSPSCTNAGKDRHRFYNYNFSIPVGSTVKGIEVRLDARTDSNSGSPKVCVQLSWDGGTTWTTEKSIAVTSTMISYILGSPTDTWGRSWTDTQLTNANFRVRLINVASDMSRDFYLDWVAVRVHY